MVDCQSHPIDLSKKALFKTFLTIKAKEFPERILQQPVPPSSKYKEWRIIVYPWFSQRRNAQNQSGDICNLNVTYVNKFQKFSIQNFQIPKFQNPNFQIP